MKNLVVLALSGLLMWGCNNTSEKTEEHHDTAEHEHDNDSTKIELVNGEKWVVNEEMKPFVTKGEELVNSFVKENKTDYKALATSLKEENNLLIKSCTMDGKSHDELHKWLHPHLELVGELENATDMAQAQTVISQLETSYDVYHMHFN